MWLQEERALVARDFTTTFDNNLCMNVVFQQILADGRIARMR